MSYPRTIRNFNAFLDGTSFIGKVSKGTMPSLKLKTEGYRGAGMDAETAIDMGMEAMQTVLIFTEWVEEAFTNFGTKKRIVLRPVAMGEDDFSVDAFIFTCGGRISGVEPGQLGAGDNSELTLTMDNDFYRIEKNNKELVKIDVENSVRIIDGIDQLADMRTAMGV